MKKLVLYFVIGFQTLTVWAYKGQVLDQKGQPIIGAVASVLSKDSVAIVTAVADSIGYYQLPVKSYPAMVSIQSVGYQTKTFLLNEEPASIVKTTLLEDQYQLKEVVVTSDMIKQYDSHTSYRISQKEIANYSNFGLALNTIPFLTVTTRGEMSYRGLPDVVVLLNGVRTSWQEIQALDKGDVSKVDVYENPPAQYRLAGASAVINIITKRTLKGGNVSLNLRDSFHPIYGDNSLAAFYNHGRSRFSLIYDNSMSHYKKVRTDETLGYNFNGEEYQKQKRGYDSPWKTDGHSLTLGYMNYLPDNYQFNANLSTSFHKEDQQKGQYVSTNGEEEIDAKRGLYNKYNQYALNLYFNKQWKGRKAFLMDVTGTMYDTSFRSAYTESDLSGATLFDERSAYTTKRYSLLSTLQYTFPSAIGEWTFGTRYAYRSSTQTEAGTDIDQRQHTLYGYAELYGHKGIFYYYLSLAAKYLNAQADGHTAWNKWYPAPSASLTLRPWKGISFRLGYSYTGDVPSVSLLSETEQWLDNFYVYKGNAALQPYSHHQLYLTGSAATKHWGVQLLGIYNYSPDDICNHFETTPGYILQTYTNLEWRKEFGGQAVIDCFPLGDKSLKIELIGIYLRQHGKETDGSTWWGKRYQLMALASYTLPKWDFEVYYQYPGQTLQGQLETPRAEVLRLSVAYKPIKDMSIGLEWNQPFMDSFSEGEHTTPGCIMQSDISNNIRDWSNMVCLSFSYSFSFGKQGKQPRQRIKNVDSDSGLLKK